MLKYNIQFFGGRGASANQRKGIQIKIPKGNNGGGSVLGEVIGTLSEALGKKKAQLSIAESIKNSNPNYDNSWNAQKAFTSNCQRCVVAYELNRRGYEVEARATYDGDVLPRIAHIDKRNSNNLIGRWQGAFQKAKGKLVGVNPGKGATDAQIKQAESATIANIQKEMRKYGSGSRAVVQILYKGGGGHVFNVENVNGNITFIEAQTGKTKDIWKTMKSVRTETVRLVRTDNLRISDRAKKFVRQKQER